LVIGSAERKKGGEEEDLDGKMGKRLRFKKACTGKWGSRKKKKGTKKTEQAGTRVICNGTKAWESIKQGRCTTQDS